MALLIVGSSVLVAFLAVGLGFVPPPYASTLIRIREGAVYVRRGQVQSLAREHIGDILRDAGVLNGYIAIVPGNAVAFSRRIPARIHQRLRNVLLNQWT